MIEHVMLVIGFSLFQSYSIFKPITHFQLESSSKTHPSNVSSTIFTLLHLSGFRHFRNVCLHPVDSSPRPSAASPLDR
ncbi:hypothetical protein PGT21_031389 [Puccinia graminis f. sp. tritici]|uniref:Uncharacterized protein n=1 Tax=Puccinia graminis f. sp. tritici TaxID=56615 RepID=A0A5B0M1W9_PUCGR|nr:hypothetical protein PGT21_033087 [Puccinia graminis f. sp. tritici]KAA1098947.1 hypothetical protein PGTUg99_004906 [Puccinia graminis f. sp. tritici]KAA1104766.1 hypothetical protein PGT21_031389 [Puccinia graminis f. sp. tritici]